MTTWNAGFETDCPMIDEINLTQLSHKHSLDVHRVKSFLSLTLHKYFANNRSILITDYSLSLLACVLEYLIYKQIQSTNGKTIFLHISDSVLRLIPPLDASKSKHFGGSLTHTLLDYSKKIFTITFGDYQYLADSIIPTSPRGRLLYVYFGNDSLNSSQLPGFADIQNLVIAGELVPSYSLQVIYPFVHIFDRQTDSKTKLSTDKDSKSVQVPDCLLIPDTALLDMLVNKHNILKQTRLVEYLSYFVMNCIARGESMVVDGFSDSLLLCLLDYIIEKRLESAACLFTLVDSTKRTRANLQVLEVSKTGDYETVKDIPNFSKEVVFLRLTKRTHKQPAPHNSILVSYTLNGCRFSGITLFQGPFLSLTRNTVRKGLLSSTHRPYTRITYLRDSVISTYWNGVEFLTTEPVDSFNSHQKFETSKDLFVPNPTTETKQADSRNMFSTDKSSKSVKVPNCLPISPSDTALLDMLVNKHNILKQTRLVEYLSSFVMDCIARGESMVVDGFSDSLLLCLLDYIIEKRLETATSSVSTLVNFTNNTCKEFDKLQVMETKDYELVTDGLNFSTRVVFFKLGSNVKNISYENCILITYTTNGTEFQDVTLFRGPFISLTTNLLSKSLLSSTHRPYTRITHLRDSVISTYWNGVEFLTTKPVGSLNSHQKSETAKDLFVPPIPGEPTSIMDPIMDPITDPITTSPLSSFITRDAEPLDRLIDKHNIQQHSHIFHNLSSSVMDCIERGSVVVEGFDPSILICLLDYVIMKRVRINPGLSIVVDSTKEHRKNFVNLDIMKMNDLNKCSVGTSNRVVFTSLNMQAINSLNTNYQGLTVISFTTCGYNFQFLDRLTCPFISLSCSNLSKRLLSTVSRPFTLISYIQDLDEFRTISRNEPKEVLTQVSDASPHPRNDNESKGYIPNEPYSPINMNYLLERLTMKYNCNLDIKICYTLYELLENGDSVIVDYFSRPQMLFIIDFIYAVKTYQKVSVLETKTLIFCQLKLLSSYFKELDVIRSNQHAILMLDGSFDRNKKVLVLRKLEKKFLDRLNQNLLIDSSYLLIRLAKKRNAKFVNIFNQLDCSFLGLSEGKVGSFPNKPFIHLRGNGFGGFEVNIPEEDISTNNGSDRVRDELRDSVSNPDIPLDIYPVFLDKYNPITTHIYELLSKFMIELLYTDLPTDLYVTAFTYLIDYRNICVDGFPFAQLIPLLTVYALECQELGFPISIHCGNDTKLPTDKLQTIPIVQNTDLIPTLTENVDARHIWIFIGIEYTLLTQIVPLLNRSHQIIFLLSNTVSAVFEQSSLAFTRIYKFLNCVFVRSFNHHLLQEFTNDISPRKFDTETSPLQTESDRFVDIEPNQNDSSEEIMQDTSMNQELIMSTQTIGECYSLKSDTDDMVMTNISCAEFKIAEINAEICESLLMETKSESGEELINLSSNHTLNIPDIQHVLECITTTDLELPTERIEASSDTIETDILHSNDNKETSVITETERKSYLPKYSHNSNITHTTDIFHHPISDSHKLETSDLDSTESTSEQISHSQQQQQQVTIPEHTHNSSITHTTDIFHHPMDSDSHKLETSDLDSTESTSEQVFLPENTILGSESCHPSVLGTQFVTSPLQHGMNTILYSSDTTFYNPLILRLSEVLDYSHSSLQVVITSQNPDICSKLLKLASSHMNSPIRGLLYKHGPINSLREYIIQQKVQILSVPFKPLVDLIQSDNCLFIDNKILVYIDDSTISQLDTHSLQILTDGMADQYIFILPDKRTLSSFPYPYSEIKHLASAKNESYFVELNFLD